MEVQNGGRTLALLVACTLFAVLSLGAPATAPGVNSAPVIRATSPAHGAIVSGPFSVSAQIDSWAGLATATVSVSGVNYPFTWTGGPEEAEFNFFHSDIPALLPGAHTVRIWARDFHGAEVEQSWTVHFVEMADVRFSDLRPAPSSSTSVSVVSAHVSGPYLDPASVAMTIDGAVVPHTWISITPTSGIAVYTIMLPMGNRTVGLSATDTQNNLRASRSWNFYMDRAPPTVRWVGPAPGTVHTVEAVPFTIHAELWDAHAGIDVTSLKLFLNGERLSPVTMSSVLNSRGAGISWSALIDPRAHSARVEATDRAGNSLVHSWSFTTRTPYLSNAECWQCHSQTLHQDRMAQTTCSLCHNNFTDAVSCTAACHQYHDVTAMATAYHSAAFYQNCLSCHDRGTPRPVRSYNHYGFPVNVVADPAPFHTPVREDARHQTTSSPQCALCHDPAITVEHEALTTRAGQAFTCLTCHAGPAGSVPAFAIPPRAPAGGVLGQSLGMQAAGLPAASGQVSAMAVTQPFACETCHVGAGHDALHDGGLASFPPSCGECHVSNLIPEHDGDCGLCHAADVDITISSAVADRDLTCNRCHPGLHIRAWGAPDYYRWDTRGGPGGRGDYLAWIGANPANPGVHGGYMANTAKCGVCHSVHRARGDGVMLLNTYEPTCAGCHLIGSTVTNVVINWGAGPHGGGDPSACQARACHLDNPHGVDGSQYAIVSQKLLNPATDALLATAIANPAASGISVTELEVATGSVWPESTRSLVRTGYNCNICHSSTQLAVVNRGWAEYRHRNIDATTQPLVLKQGHIGAAGVSVDASETWGPGLWQDEATQTAFAPVTDCESCHDQTDDRTRTGFTFPHGQTPVGASNLGAGRALLWMGWSGGAGTTLTPITTEDMKAYDGNCLKCHRSATATAGVGVTY